jgi:O-antigen/teichoic acid export membrane protein
MIYLKRIFKFSFGNYIAGFLIALPTILFPLIITQLFNPRLTAFFFIAWTIGIIFPQISHSISLSLLVEGSHKPEKLQENKKKAWFFNAIIFLPLIFVFIFFGDWVLIFFGEDYSAFSFDLLRVLALSSPLVAIVNINLSVLRVKKEIIQVIIISGIIGIATLFIGAILLQFWGLVGIGVAWGMSHAMAIIFIAIRKLKYHNPQQ